MLASRIWVILKMSVEGISHITLLVKDLERSANLLMAVFEAEQVYSSDSQQFSFSREKFFIVGGIWLALMEGSPLPERNYNHIAFKIPASEYECFKKRLKAVGVEYKEDRSRVQGEGVSLYFYDFDNHLFELHTGTLEERLNTYRQLKTANKLVQRSTKSRAR
jgi:fosfomycin resistance protein FosX